MQSAGRGALVLLLVPVLVAGGLIALILLLFGPSTQGTSCGPSRVVEAGDLPDTPVAGYSGDQLANAAAIMNAGVSAGLQRDAQVIAVMVAIAESDLRALDHGTDARPDGLGLFQQPDAPEWGTIADRVDPSRSAANFYTALAGVPEWPLLAPTIVAHRIQGGDDPYRFEGDYAAAAEVVGTLAGGGQTVCQSGYLVLPLDAGYQMTDDFGDRPCPLPRPNGTCGASTWHPAVDLQNWPGPCGQPIYAVTAGAVTIAAGYQISVKSPDGYTVSYLHMYPSDMLVGVGDNVIAGQQIARVGSNGPSTGCHLDIRMNIVGNTNAALEDLRQSRGFVDPEDFYDAFGVPLCPADTCRRTY